MNEQLTTLLLKIPRGIEITPEPAQTFLATLTQINSVTRFARLRGEKPQVLSLEITLYNQQIKFMITCDRDLAPFIEAQIQSNYPLVIIQHIPDPLPQMGEMNLKRLGLRKGGYSPISTYPAFQDVDPLASILSVLSKADPTENAVVQFALESIDGSWQGSGQAMIEKGVVTVDGEGNKSRSALPDEGIVKEKISFPGFAVSVRLAAGSPNTLNALASAFGVYTRTDGNAFAGKSWPLLSRKDTLQDLYSREVRFGEILNIHELATLWHMPGDKVKTSSILWGHTVLSEAPENLPASMDMTDEEKTSANFFAKTRYKNTEAVFGIKDRDRGRHVWVIGKTGTGKSTLIANMVIDDIRKGRGVGVIDPHGDLVQTVLDYVPSNRINDVIYFNPADREYPIVINPLQVQSKEAGELVVSGLMSIFTKIWANVWSARMEYIMRNSLMTLTEIPGATLADVLTLLADASYRNHVVQTIKDDSLKDFWLTEYNKMPERLQKEAISPIQNKVGQFVTSPMIRRIIGNPTSTINIEDAMNNSMIFLANLSQGRLGEDNSALLGATLITKFQQAAMNRVDIPEDDRVPFNLFVDEFQNFATESFIKILSEARKYKLNLMLANQYMAQIPEDVQKAILGNVGSMISFRVGAEDAQIIHQEYGEVFSQNDLVSLANFQIATRLMIDNQSSRSFLANTLPLPASKNQNRQTIIDVSRERWAKSATELKEERERKRAEKEANKKAAGPPPQQNNQGPPWQKKAQGGHLRARPQGLRQHSQNRKPHHQGSRPQHASKSAHSGKPASAGKSIYTAKKEN